MSMSQSEEHKHAVRLGKAQSDLLAYTKRAEREIEVYGKATSCTIGKLHAARAIVSRLRRGEDW